TVENGMPPTTSSKASTSKFLFWALNALLGVAFIAEISTPWFSALLDGATVMLAAAASMAALNRQLPLQNVLSVAAMVAVVGGVAHGLSSNPNLSLPLGPIVFNPAAGGKIFYFVPWTIPLLWIVAIFNARGVGRLILRPWRKIKNYGFWLIGLTAVLATAFDVALEPFASYVKHLWFWQRTKIPVTWEGTTLLNFVGWPCVALLILLIATPSLIRKQPGNPSAPDFHPLALWLGALVLFAVGSARAGLWGPVAVDAVIAGVTTVFALRGAKW
ncbi:MAG TPA: carotenoid biosynthesis protein, partial [Verrucomicrobiae bacterium]|nr:carotenoid biosynthesis protein [Verrucomicrobiae bacterium]